MLPLLNSERSAEFRRMIAKPIVVTIVVTIGNYSDGDRRGDRQNDPVTIGKPIGRGSADFRLTIVVTNGRVSIESAN